MQVSTKSQEVSLGEEGFYFSALEVKNTYECKPAAACVVEDVGKIKIQLTPSSFSTAKRVSNQYYVLESVYLVLSADPDYCTSQFLTRNIMCLEDSVKVIYTDSLTRSTKMFLDK